MLFFLGWTVSYFVFRGYKRYQRKKQKNNDKANERELTEFEKGVAERKRQNRKRCCLIEFVRLKRVQQLNCVICLAMTITTIIITAKVWNHAAKALKAYKITDCSFHRLLEYMNNGQQDINLLTTDELGKLPRSRKTIGFLGLKNYPYYLEELFKNVKTLKPITNTDYPLEMEKVNNMQKDYNRMGSLDESKYKVDSCANVTP